MQQRKKMFQWTYNRKRTKSTRGPFILVQCCHSLRLSTRSCFFLPRYWSLGVFSLKSNKSWSDCVAGRGRQKPCHAPMPSTVSTATPPATIDTPPAVTTSMPLVTTVKPLEALPTRPVARSQVTRRFRRQVHATCGSCTPSRAKSTPLQDPFLDTVRRKVMRCFDRVMDCLMERLTSLPRDEQCLDNFLRGELLMAIDNCPPITPTTRSTVSTDSD